MKKIKSFAPHLAPNQQPDLDSIDYSREYHASTKLDGIRLLVKDGVITTRSLKSLPNKQLNDKFEPLRAFTCDERIRNSEKKLLIDGEIYAEGVPFQLIMSCCMTQDYADKKAIKAWVKLCNEHEVDYTREEVLNLLKFYMFDCVTNENFNSVFRQRYENVLVISKYFPNLIVPVEQKIVKSANEVRAMFKEVLSKGYEGLMLKSLDCPYKFGRSTLSSGHVYKVKPYISVDERIVSITQATVVNPDAPKTINELNRSVTSKLKENRILIPRASCFVVNYEGHSLDVAIGQTEKVRDEIWKNPDSYIGRMIEFKGLQVGMKDVPRHCNFIRFRNDKD